VPAGHDRFDFGLMNASFQAFMTSAGLTVNQLMQLGRERRTTTANRSQ